MMDTERNRDMTTCAVCNLKNLVYKIAVPWFDDGIDTWSQPRDPFEYREMHRYVCPICFVDMAVMRAPEGANIEEIRLRQLEFLKSIGVPYKRAVYDIR